LGVCVYLCQEVEIRIYFLLSFKFKYMITIQGLFDGKNIIALDKIPTSKKTKVFITFIEETDEGEEIRHFSAQTDSFAFWKSEEEDIYQDYLKK
jgi:hypothetical protein